MSDCRRPGTDLWGCMSLGYTRGYVSIMNADKLLYVRGCLELVLN